MTMYAIGGKKSKPIFDPADKLQKIQGWRMTGEKGQQYNMLLPECVTYQMFDPDKPFDGLTPLDPGRLNIMAAYNADLYNASMFANGCEPGTVLSTDAPFDQDQDRQIRTTWSQRHQGTANALALAVLWGGLTVNDSLAQTNNDMQWWRARRPRVTRMCSSRRKKSDSGRTR